MKTIERDVFLAPFHSLGTPHQARFFVRVTSIDDLCQAVQWAQHHAMPIGIIGQGTNIFFIDNFNGLIIKNELIKITAPSAHNDTGKIIITAGAGVVWDDFVSHTLQHQCFGLENLSGIPGTVGAAPIQNIGAYGVEVGDAIDAVEYLNVHTGQIQEITQQACRFGYRDSIFKHDLKDKAIITAVRFKLHNTFQPLLRYQGLHALADLPNPSAQDLRLCVLNLRKEKIPDYRIFKNAGSFFKNPVIPLSQLSPLLTRHPQLPHFIDSQHQTAKIPAAFLIEHSGWKGRQVGNVKTAPQHALIVINEGVQSGQDIIHFAQKIQHDVLQKWGIKLEMEVNVMHAT